MLAASGKGEIDELFDLQSLGALMHTGKSQANLCSCVQSADSLYSPLLPIVSNQEWKLA